MSPAGALRCRAVIAVPSCKARQGAARGPGRAVQAGDASGHTGPFELPRASSLLEVV